MAKIEDLVKRVDDPKLRREMESAVAELKRKTRFGLVYEEHLPEMTALPGLPIAVGSLVVRRERLSTRHAFRVMDISDGVATLQPLGKGDPQTAPLAHLVALQEFGKPIYPGLEKVGSVERGGPQRPHHAVINAENYYALKTLTWTHRGRVDAIYIDPPYNTGARDWKYNNDYVVSDDVYRHSKWLAMMERRLRVAKELLNPADSVLIVTIDEKEYLRLGLLLEQTFPDARIQMITSVIAPQGQQRPGQFSRIEEYLFVLLIGDGKVAHWNDQMIETSTSTKIKANEGPSWDSLIRRGTGATRADRPGMFYPVFVKDGELHSVGEPLPLSSSRTKVSMPEDVVSVWPIRTDGSEGRWQVGPERLRELFSKGYAKIGKPRGRETPAIMYLKAGEIDRFERGDDNEENVVSARSVWNKPSHNAGAYGSTLLRAILPERKFPFPKSLYAVEDALRFFVANKPDAVILDFFAGSGTTAHAVMRLNKQDGGRRQCISVTNNEVGADEHKDLREKGLYPGDPEWERWGICDYITKPRIEAAVTGKTPDGKPIAGDYKFTDEFPMADGFEENVTFFKLNYLDPDRVDMGQQFEAISPLLWLSAGGIGTWEGDAAKDDPGYSFPEGAPYGVVFKESRFQSFLAALNGREDITHVFLVTDSEDAYAEMRAALPRNIIAKMLYRDYLRSFRVSSGGETRA